MYRRLLHNLAIMSDKTGMSDRSAATIASIVLEWAGLVNKCDSFLVIYKSKVRRARKRVRLEVQENMNLSKSLESIYFDRRKDAAKIEKNSEIKAVG